jgi:hypothetical protein
LEQVSASAVRAARQSTDFPVAFVFAVVCPALFWSAIVFVVCRLCGVGSAPQASVAVFAAATAFLSFVCMTLRVRL